MKTRLECRSLGEDKGNYTTSSVKQIRQKDTSAAKAERNDSSNGSGAGKLAAGLIAGAGVGILAGILLAPEKGKDVRKRVTESASKITDQLTKGYNAGMEKANSLMGKKDGNKSEETRGKVQKSPYTDTNKHDDARVDAMIEDAGKQPGVAGGPVSTTGTVGGSRAGNTGTSTPPPTGGNKPATGGPGVSGKQPGMIE
ncbi:YtxH domain-containing protein [Pontibacter silvestris]|uniref:YtxH domain-containing protein n=1 Tax=Pontibacter silvestris TaxID=2305183 RepID=A0ABW4WU19_9BACT|nr:YtxH domain-containing protein [Pontibacter silvestris]MCC9138063.1 YtxH domain-containing protein [Pontibacter silvestris]